MKTKTTPANRHTTARDLTLAKLGQAGPFLEGHLSPFKRPGCATPGWHLTFKQKGRTRTVYVPMSLVTEVKAWTRNYKRLKKLIREVTRHSLALVRTHVANQRAAKRAQAWTRP
jgi:alpha-acetolactate decarboxylase